MDAFFALDVDPARDLIRTRLGGFFTPEALVSYLAARQQAFARLRCPVTQHLALTDVREMKIQSQEMVGAFGTMLANPATRARRLAFVVASTLARSQVRRAMGARDAGFFVEPADAERWLFQEVAASRAA